MSKDIRDLNVKETPSTAKAKRGRPKEINRVVTKTSQSGLREGLTRATFIIREDTLDKLKERAYTDRKKLKDLVTEALDYYLEDEEAISELSALISSWAKKYGKKYSKHIQYNYKEIDIELRLMQPEIERKLVD